jgi:ribonuclease HIII
MASLIYNRLFYNLAKKLVDLSTDDIKVALLTSAYTPNKDHNNYAAVSANECPATGNYVTGGFSLTTKTVTQDDTLDQMTFDADDLVIAAATITARYAFVYDNTLGGKDACFLYDFVTDKISTAQEFRVAWAAAGMQKLYQP